jgi:hypothetical protein
VRRQQSTRMDRTASRRNNGRTTKESTGNGASPTGVGKLHHIPTTNAHASHNIGLAEDIGRAIGLALRTATPAGAMPTATKGTNVVWPYTKDEYALIMGFCNVVRAQDIPRIWRHFAASKVKQVEIHRRQLQKLMEDWSHNYRTKINTIFFKKKTLEDIINLRFDPGEGIAQYRTAERGITMLVCRPRGIEETERLRDHKHAMEATKSTRTLQEASNLTTSKPRLPASTFHEVRCNIGTFCAFLYILFGNRCEYYAKLMDVKKTFDDPSTQSIHKAFTVPVCRRIVWAIVCNGQFFFSKVKLSQDLIPGSGWKDPPTSLLYLIMDKVMFTEQIIRPTFPSEWETVVEPLPTHRGNQRTGGGTSQTGDCSQPRGGGNQGGNQGNPYQQGEQCQQGQKTMTAWTSPKEARHPKIKALMDPLLAKDFCISVKTVCQAGNTPMYELPTLPKYRDSTGRSTICWNNMLKGCG